MGFKAAGSFKKRPSLPLCTIRDELYAPWYLILALGWESAAYEASVICLHGLEAGFKGSFRGLGGLSDW